MERRMTPEEFHIYWQSDDQTAIIAGEYTDAESQEDKTRVLMKYGLSDYKSEVEREIWLEHWSYDQFSEMLEELSKGVASIDEFEAILDKMELRDYEREYLLSAHIGGLVALWRASQGI